MKKYRRLIEGIADHALFMLDTQGRISLWPGGAQKLYGYEPQDVVGQRLDVLFSKNRGESPSIEDLLAEASAEPTETEGWHERADGSVFWGSCTLSPVSNGDFDGHAVVVRDKTTDKQYERMLERQNDRLKEFTDILSHDLRTPLEIIEGHLELFRETGDEQHLATIEATTDRMERLVEDLLRVARQGQVVERPEAVDIRRILETAKEGTLPGTATLDYEPVPSVMADPDRLVQLFENLLRNGVEHAGEDVTLRVGPLENGFYIEDNGPGIPEVDRDRIFDHGFTTRQNGSGYGLSVVRSIVNAHGWDISVTEGSDGGARFETTGIEFVTGS